MARPPSPPRWKWSAALAFVRLLFLYIALCYALLEIGFASRDLWEALPFLPQSSPARTNTAFPSRLAGVNVALEQYIDRPQRRAALSELAGAGFGWVRQRVDWGGLESSPGFYDWTQLDGIVGDVAAAGLEIVVVLDGSPAWARAAADRPPTDNPFAPPADNGDFARFAATIARRYGEQIRFYQIWDEPNIAPHGGNRWVEPVAYGRLLAAAAPAIRAADPDAVILLAALAPTVDRGHTAIDESYYLRRLYAAGAAPHFDAVAAQPFGFGLAPDDPSSRVEMLNFRRVGLLRRVMVAAGDGGKPIWAVRYGWNRTTNPIWQTVTPAAQSQYMEQATALAQNWPWLAGLGWAIDQPDAPLDDPLWGFALRMPNGQPAPLFQSVRRVNLAVCATPDRCAESDISTSNSSLLAHLSGLVAWTIALLWILWRGWCAGQIVGLTLWSARFARMPVSAQAAVWVGLVIVYYFATWPPLIALCWLVAALLLLCQPMIGLWLAAFFLPFHFQHKELALVGGTLAIPPAHALLLCSLPGLYLSLGTKLAAFPKPASLKIPDWLAIGWLCTSLLSAIAAWDWAVTPGALWWLVVAPLLLYALARVLVSNPKTHFWATCALAAGSLVVALMGLLFWLGGDGVAVDGVRRLIGLTFSPNQTALILARGLFVSLGVALASRGEWRWVWLAGGGVIGLALLLTGSRGALLLGLPAGGAVWCLLQPKIRRVLLQWRWLLLAGGVVGLGGAMLFLAGRLLNSESVAQRLFIWQGSLELWRAYPWLGVGPGGFFWHYPAFLSGTGVAEPNLLHPHNLWLEFATGGGLLGLLWLLAFGCWLTRRIFSPVRPPSALETGLLAALMAGLAHSQVDAFGALPEMAAWNWLAIGVLGWKEGNEEG